MALPRELTDHIVGYIEPWDTQTLSACALASHTLLAASRSRLLANVSLRRGKTDQLCTLISSPLSTLPCRIRGITFIDRVDRFDATDQYNFPRIIAALTHLKSLTIHSYFYAPLPLDPVSPPCLPYLTFIELLGISFDSVGEVIAFVCAFPTLRTLLLLGVSWRTPAADSNIAQGTHLPPGLNTLRLMSGCEDFVWWVLAAHSVEPDEMTDMCLLPPVETLTFDGVSSTEAPAIYKFIGALARSLKSLSIYFKPNQATPEVTLCGHPVLAKIPTLRIMRFSGMSIVRNARF